MGETIRARVKRGVLEPLEKVDLPEGKEVLVTIMRILQRAIATLFGAPLEGGRVRLMLKRSFGTFTRIA